MCGFLSSQAFKLLQDIDILVRKVQKISNIRQEVASLKKAADDALNFLQSNNNLIPYWFSKVSVICTIHKMNTPQKLFLPTSICPLKKVL